MKWTAFTGDTVYLDTNILILAIEQGNAWSHSLKDLFECIDENAVHAFTSEVTIAEVLVKPMGAGATDLIEKYEQLLSGGSVVNVVPIDRAILVSAAALQGRLKIKLMDAVHVATAIASACNFFLTCDVQLGQRIRDDIRWLPLSDVTGSDD